MKKHTKAIQSIAMTIFAGILTLCSLAQPARADVDTIILKAVKGRKIALKKKRGGELKGMIRFILKTAVIVETDNGAMVKVMRRSLVRVRLLKQRTARTRRPAPRNNQRQDSRRDDRRDDRNDNNDRNDKDNRRDDRNDRDARRRDKDDRRDTRNDTRSSDRRSDKDARDNRRDDRNDKDNRRNDRDDRDDRRSDKDDRRDDRSARNDRRSRRDDRRDRPAQRHRSFVHKPKINTKALLMQKFAAARTLRNVGMAMTITGLAIQLAGATAFISTPNPTSAFVGILIMQPVGGATWIAGAPMWGVGNTRMRNLKRQMGPTATAAAPAPRSYGAATLLSAQ